MRSKVQLTHSSSPYNCICISYIFQKKGATRIFSVFKFIRFFYLNIFIFRTSDISNYFLHPVGVRKIGVVLYKQTVLSSQKTSRKSVQTRCVDISRPIDKSRLSGYINRFTLVLFYFFPMQ